MTTETMEELACRVRARLEGGGKIGNPVVVADEFLLRGVGVVDAVDPVLGQCGVVGVRRTEEVMLAARLMQIVIEIRARRNEAVDVAGGDEMGKEHSEAAWG